MDGTINEDVIVFKIISVITLIFSILIAFISYRAIYGIAIIFFLGLEVFLLNKMLTIFDYKEVITTSIMMCDNYLMLLWLIFQMIFAVLSLIHIFKK